MFLKQRSYYTFYRPIYYTTQQLFLKYMCYNEIKNLPHKFVKLGLLKT